MKLLNLIQGSSEWKKYRKDHIGASDAPIIMQKSIFKTKDGRLKTPYLLWQEKLGLVNFDIPTEAMQFGHDMEPVARNMYEEMVGEEFNPTVAEHDSISYMIASFDGLNKDRSKAV